LANWNLLKEQIKVNKELTETGKDFESFLMYHDKTLPLVLELGANFRELSDFNYKGGINSTKQGAYLTDLTNVSMVFTIIISTIITLLIFQIIRKSTRLIGKTINSLKE
jgi:hypothetical protein